MNLRSLLIIGTMTLLPLFLLAQEDPPFPPVGYSADRYERMMRHSPFVLPSFDESETVAPDWTSDFQIVSVIKLGEESVVLAKKISTDERIPIRTQENALGIRLVALQLSPNPQEVSATIAMSGQEGIIKYDASILANLPTSAMPNNPAIKSE